jgi:hypothetical protein
MWADLMRNKGEQKPEHFWPQLLFGRNPMPRIRMWSFTNVEWDMIEVGNDVDARYTWKLVEKFIQRRLEGNNPYMEANFFDARIIPVEPGREDDRSASFIDPEGIEMAVDLLTRANVIEPLTPVELEKARKENWLSNETLCHWKLGV